MRYMIAAVFALLIIGGIEWDHHRRARRAWHRIRLRLYRRTKIGLGSGAGPTRQRGTSVVCRVSQNLGEVVMNDERLRHILAEELEKETGLPPSAADHIGRIRSGDLSPGLTAAIRAMRRAADEARVLPGLLGPSGK